MQQGGRRFQVQLGQRHALPPAEAERHQRREVHHLQPEREAKVSLHEIFLFSYKDVFLARTRYDLFDDHFITVIILINFLSKALLIYNPAKVKLTR